MSHPNKVKGNKYERELVKAFTKAGYQAKRAYASNGLSMGKTEETDLVVDVNGTELLVQAKRRKKLPVLMTEAMKNVNVAVFREDNGKSIVAMELELLFDLIKKGAG